MTRRSLDVETDIQKTSRERRITIWDVTYEKTEDMSHETNIQKISDVNKILRT